MNFIFGLKKGIGSCNHDRAPIYFAESINSEAGFWGFKCKEWKDWALGLCRNSDELAPMGWPATNEYVFDKCKRLHSHCSIPLPIIQKYLNNINVCASIIMNC